MNKKIYIYALLITIVSLPVQAMDNENPIGNPMPWHSDRSILKEWLMDGNFSAAEDFCLLNPSIINETDTLGNTLLHECAHEKPRNTAVNSTAIISFLIKHGASVNAQNKKWCTPLHLAISSGNINNALFLIHSGANPALENCNNKNAWNLAQSNQQAYLLLLQSYTEYQTFHIADVFQFLINAVNNDDLDKVNFVCKRYPELVRTITDVYGNSSLHYAAFKSTPPNGNPKINQVIIQTFIDTGVPINAKNSSGNTPLHHITQRTSMHNVPSLISLLIRNRARVDENNGEGNTPLHYLIKKRYGEIKEALDILIKNKVNVNAFNYLGNTPLHVAVTSYQTDNVVFLLKNGANPAIRNSERLTPLDIAHPQSRAAEILKAQIKK